MRIHQGVWVCVALSSCVLKNTSISGNGPQKSSAGSGATGNGSTSAGASAGVGGSAVTATGPGGPTTPLTQKITVTAVDGSTIQTVLPALPALTNVVGHLGEDSVGIDFDPVDGAKDYRVYAQEYDIVAGVATTNRGRTGTTHIFPAWLIEGEWHTDTGRLGLTRMSH